VLKVESTSEMAAPSSARAALENAPAVLTEMRSASMRLPAPVAVRAWLPVLIGKDAAEDAPPVVITLAPPPTLTSAPPSARTPYDPRELVVTDPPESEIELPAPIATSP